MVYLPEESLVQEYVMNEDGTIYMGTWDYIKSIPWNYGQVAQTHPHTHSKIVPPPIPQRTYCLPHNTHSVCVWQASLWELSQQGFSQYQDICLLDGGNMWIGGVRM